MDTTTATVLAALIAPLAVAFVKQIGLSSSVNGFLALVCYVAFGGLAVASTGQPLDPAHIAAASATFTAVGTAAYQAFWSHTDLEAALTASTSIVKGQVIADTLAVPATQDVATLPGDSVPS